MGIIKYDDNLNIRIQGAIFDYFALVEDMYDPDIVRIAKGVFRDAYIIGIKSLEEELTKLTEKYEEIIKSQEAQITLLLNYVKSIIKDDSKIIDEIKNFMGVDK